MTNIIVNQFLVAGSTLLAALPVGCSVNYPSVLLHQLSSNDSSIQLDWDTASWIGAIHGIAAIPSILMPALMQWRGRKLAFILACLVSIVGWIVAFTATTSTAILISESLHGFGSQSIMSVGLLTMSEMLSPQIRNVIMGFYLVVQSLGMAFAGILGSYLHWRTLSLVICAPLIVTAVAACMWPESPSWLAYKGEFDKCAKSFICLRGTGDLALTELKELILAQKERISSKHKCKNKHFLRSFWSTIKSRDFYLPGLHIFTLLFSVYWVGGLVILIYSSEVIPRATFTKDAVVFGNTLLNSAMFLGCILGVMLIRHIQPKLVLLGTSSCTVVALLIASGVNIFQIAGTLSKETYICLYILCCSLLTMNVSSPIVVTICAELMPVKHRGIGGPLFSSITCLLHTSLMKIGPYMLKYMSLWGMLLVFASNSFVSNIFIWNFVPETKGRTLQQLEDYYAYGTLEKRRCIEVKADLQELQTADDDVLI